MTKEIFFIIPGKPMAKSRPRFTKMGFSYTPKETVQYENLVKYAFIDAGGTRIDERPMSVCIVAFFPISSSKSKKIQSLMNSGEIRPTIKSDADNIAKIVCDSLNEIAWKDDAYVVSLQVEKYYSTNPRVEVRIKPLFPA